MPIEDHPLYPRWRHALERVIATKAARDSCQEDTPAYTIADSEYQTALVAYDMVAREI
jgi:hypothetical protein